jgi:RimJ/RimL family protein N-acetyltransferase
MSGLRIETERLVLRQPRLEDAPAAAEMLGNGEVMRFLGGETVPAGDVPAVLQKGIDRWEFNDAGPFVIELREDGRFVGRSGVLVWDTRTWTHGALSEAGEHAQPEIGWALARAHWGNGYATETALAVRDWARRERDFGHLISLIAPGNVASQSVARRMGAYPTETVEPFDTHEAVLWVHV